MEIQRNYIQKFDFTLQEFDPDEFAENLVCCNVLFLYLFLN